MCFNCTNVKRKDEEKLIKDLYWCIFCGRYFKKYDTFKKHIESHNEYSDKKYLFNNNSE